MTAPGSPAPSGLGAVPVPGGVRFRVWAPAARTLEVILDSGRTIPMTLHPAGIFEAVADGIGPRIRYRYRVDGAAEYPDPASRLQPEGLHGPSIVVDPRHYAWHDQSWTGLAAGALVFYELHVGTFTPEGTLAAARERLPYLRDLGITAVELMPVGEFPGRWNWGYDPGAMFAPSRAYGTPDDLRALVDEAHRLGLAVFLDVVYNHFGPDGAYAAALSPAFFSPRHRTPWGAAINLDGEGSPAVRAFFIDNARHWLIEYHLDGLRLDATHAIVDESPVHFLAELAAAVRGVPGWPRYLVAEDHRNLDRLVRRPDEGGYGLDAVWSDDYHHQVRRILTGQDDGYFADFTASTRELATIIRQGWLYTGQHASFFRGKRGTDPAGIPPHRFVHCVQNHDQVGNRPQGDRLTQAVGLPAYRAVSTLLLCAPQTPLLFMGQEWASRSPFLYFTDHAGELGRRVTEGRRREFRGFRGFETIPDPQDPATFQRSKLDWDEAATAPHAGILQLYRDLLYRRRQLGGPDEASSPADGGIVLRRGRHLILAALREDVELPLAPAAEIVWHSEQPPYAADPHPPERRGASVRFPRESALIAELPG